MHIKNRYSFKSHALVLLQFVSIGLCCWPFATTDYNFRWPALVIFAGLSIVLLVMLYNRPGNFSIYPTPKSDTTLITSGPYKTIRHPMYTGLVVAMLGISLFHNNLLNYLGLLLLTIVIIGKSAHEEDYLKKQFAEYTDYIQRTKRFIPYIF